MPEENLTENNEKHTEFIYVLNLAEERLRSPEGWTEEETAIVGRHFRHLTDLYEKGIVKYVGRTVDDRSSFGLVVFDADNEEEAKKLMESDPAIKNGVMTATLYPFKAIYK